MKTNTSITLTKEQQSSALKAIDDLLSPTGENRFRLTGKPGVPTETIIILATGALSPAEMAKLRKEIEKLDREFMIGAHMNNSHTDAEASAQAHETNQSGARRLTDGKPADPRDGWSVEDWKSDFRNKRRVGRLAMEQAGKEVIPLLKAVAQKIDQHIGATADRIVADDYALHQRFAIPYWPSELIQTIRAARDQMRFQVGKWDANEFLFPRPADAAAAVGIVINREEVTNHEAVRIAKKTSFLDRAKAAAKSALGRDGKNVEEAKEVQARINAANAEKEARKQKMAAAGIIRLAPDNPLPNPEWAALRGTPEQEAVALGGAPEPAREPPAESTASTAQEPSQS